MSCRGEFRLEQEPAKPQDGEKAEHPPRRHRFHSGWLGMAIFLGVLGFASFALPARSFATAMPLLLLSLFCALLALFTRPPAANNAAPPSSGAWLGLAVILFVGGLVACGSGSAAILFVAAVFTLPAVLRRRPVQRIFGVILLLLSLAVGISLYSEQGWGPYGDYLLRAKASEAVNLLASLKKPVEAFYAERKYCPTPEEIGVKTQGKYVAGVARTSAADDAKCVYTATLKDGLGFGANATLGLAYSPEAQTWSCKDQDTGTSKLSPRYLPGSCKL